MIHVVMLPEMNDCSAYLTHTLRWWAPAPVSLKNTPAINPLQAR